MLLQEPDDLSALIEGFVINKETGALLLTANSNQAIVGLVILIDIILCDIGASLGGNLCADNLAEGTGLKTK